MDDFDPWGALAKAKETLANSSQQLPKVAKAISEADHEVNHNSSRLATLAEPRGCSSRQATVAVKKEKELDIIIIQGLSPLQPLAEAADNPVPASTGTSPLAKVAKRLEKDPTPCFTSEFLAFRVARANPYIPAPDELAKAPTEWVDGFACLSSREFPCPGFRDWEWPAVFDAAHLFLEQHAEAAHALGWTALDLFGVHPVVGAARVDHCGALMVSSGARVVLVERDIISFGPARFYRRPSRPDAVLVWGFNSKAGVPNASV